MNQCIINLKQMQTQNKQNNHPKHYAKISLNVFTNFTLETKETHRFGYLKALFYRQSSEEIKSQTVHSQDDCQKIQRNWHLLPEKSNY
jgi:anionic cell wall polymer biosynthesis LytR-Cps2A-Psr (LCP) family protein